MFLSRIRAYLQFRGLDPENQKRILFLESCFNTKLYEYSNYLKALRHRSRLVDSDYGLSDSYERLEFLGDAVLDLIITEILFERFPDKDEGFMTQLRSKLVKGDALAGYSKEMNLPEIIELGDRAKGQGIEFSTSILADIFEALIGALYKDRGYATTRKFVEGMLDSYLNMQELANLEDNYKSILMEYAQARKMRVPVYRVVAEHGPAHNRHYDVEVFVGDLKAGEGSGRSKKLAEQEAAKAAFAMLNANPDALSS